MMQFLSSYIPDLTFYLQQYADRYAFLVPLGLIGVWRWSVWIGKEIIGSNYTPKTKEYRASVSIITPVYNEHPDVFRKALASWKKNKPKEIIAVIDYSDKTCIDIFKKFARTSKNAVLIVTKKPGKRPALADGIAKATSEIVALVDSDTIWDENVIRFGLSPFNDKKVAGVATYQSVLEPKTFAQKIFDVQLDLRYMQEYPFLAAAGDALVCLSGRTAFYRREIVDGLREELVNETFFGKPVISGDDKCLTYLVLAAGWKVAYQSNSHVYTPGMADLGSYLKQRIRWSRNSLRADMKAIYQGWPLKHPALFFFQIDKVLQSFVVILSPIFFFIAVAYREWIIAAIIFAWWFISRAIKMHSHLAIKPQNISILPGFVIYSFLTGIIKIYALFTLNTQGWITRWDKSRMKQLRFLNEVPAYMATAVVISFLSYGLVEYKQNTYFAPREEKQQVLAQAFTQEMNSTLAQNAVLGAQTEQKDLLVRKYVSQQGDTIDTIATKYQITSDRVYHANSAKLPFPWSITPGTVISIPGKDVVLDTTLSMPYGNGKDHVLSILYVASDNTIVVMGRGNIVTLTDIQNAVGSNYLYEEKPKQWIAKASIYLHQGVTLNLDRDEAEWLKLESNAKQFVMVRTKNGDIIVNGVKITSWDSDANTFDMNLDDGRSFIMAKGMGRMDFTEAEASYLGYPTSPELTVSPYGVSWKITDDMLLKTLLTGEVVDSTFHHNYFGTYTFGATGMLWKGNEFYENVRYGLDPHDDSNGFLVEENYSHNNGTHGIIFSKRCMYNTVRNNVSINNGLHGIMLHEQSDNNIIENNTITGNVSGVALWRSSKNIVRNNIVKANKHGIRANESSYNNLLTDNVISESERYGFYLYDGANDNILAHNSLSGNQVGVYIKSDRNSITENTLNDNDIGLYFLDTAAANSVRDNTIEESNVYGIYTKIQVGMQNILDENTLVRNRKSIDGMELSEEDFE